MNQILRTKKTKLRVAITVSIFLVLLIVLSLSFAIANGSSNKILKGVYINNIYVGEMTKEEALEVIEKEVLELEQKKVRLRIENYSRKLSGKDLGINFVLVEEALNQAYDYGRDGNILINNYIIMFSKFKDKEFLIKISVNDELLDEVINNITQNVPSITNDDTYQIEEDKIKIYKGHEGIKIKKEELKDLVTNALVNNQEEIDIPTEISAAKRLDFNEIYNKIYVKVKNAEFSDGENFEVTPEIYGREFDIDSAVSKYNALKDGENMEIEIKTIVPEVKVADLNTKLFKDLLAKYQTKYDTSYTNRVTNLKMAASKINGTILYPGEEFSYNKVVGERTEQNGFKKAHVFAGGRVVDGLGGGICQISTTLYNTVIMTNLDVTERKNHMMHTGYQPPGRDATVVYGSIDFKFKNNRELPIKIEMTVDKGMVTSYIYGVRKENEPIVDIETVILKTIPYTTVREDDPTMDVGQTKVVQYPLNGYQVETYKILKDINGNLISRTLISKDSYLQTSQIIKVGTNIVNTEPTIPVQQGVEEPSGETPESSEEPVVETTEPIQTLPPGWDTPENPYVNI